MSPANNKPLHSTVSRSRGTDPVGGICWAAWLSSGHGTNSHRCYRRDPFKGATIRKSISRRITNSSPVDQTYNQSMAGVVNKHIHST